MMKAAVAESEVGSGAVSASVSRAAAAVPSRLADYLELTKPRIAVMALFTVAAGYLLGAGAASEARVLFHTLLGAGLVAAGGSALNQLMGADRRADEADRERPLPAGRLSMGEVAVFRAVLSGVGLAYLLGTVSVAPRCRRATSSSTCWSRRQDDDRVEHCGRHSRRCRPSSGGARRGWDGAGGATALPRAVRLAVPHFWRSRGCTREYARALADAPGCDPEPDGA